MNRREQLIILRKLASGSYYNGIAHYNSIMFSRDLKETLVFHSSNYNITDNLRSGLYVTFDVEAARHCWSSYSARKCVDAVNAFAVPLDEIPREFFHFSNGDSWERCNGGRGLIWEVSYLKPVVFAKKSNITQAVKDLGYLPYYYYNAWDLLDYFIFEKDVTPQVTMLDQDNFNLCCGLFRSHERLCLRLEDTGVRYNSLGKPPCDGFNW